MTSTNVLRSTTIFVSYSRSDGEFVTRLIADLDAAGVKVWIDKRGLKAGTPDWEQALRDAIRDTNAVLLIASPSSRRSPYVRDELAIAKMHRRGVYPVWAAGEDWIDCIPMGMGHIQFIDA